MENAELTQRFPISENWWLIQNFNGIHRFVKLTVNKGFLAVNVIINAGLVMLNFFESVQNKSLTYQ